MNDRNLNDRRLSSGRLYRRMIRLFFPPEVVQRHGDDMETTFLRILDIEGRRRGRLGVSAAWLGAFADGIRNGWLGGREGQGKGAEQINKRRRRAGFAVSWLDAKLGIRMLGKHPGLTSVALFALAIGIPVGLAPWHLFRAMEAPLPVEDGQRIRLLRHWNVETSRADATTLYDYERWRAGLSAFNGLGAFRRGMFNVGSGEGPSAPAPGAEVTASTFGILRVAPLHGRTLLAQDEIVGAPNVVVIGHDLWQARFGGDPSVMGRTIQVAQAPHTVVGVMPAGFRFPVRDQMWLPLRERPASEPFAGRALTIFGRLADGATSDSAQAELASLGSHLAIENPVAYARLNAEVVSFAFVAFGFPKGGALATPEFYLGELLTLLLLGVACANVAMLMFARAATRTAEFAVRTALGASRIRVVSQMFTESLVLAVIAAGLGLVAIEFVLDRLLYLVAGELPYWIDLGMTWSTGLWALSLAVLSAVVAGVVPALRVTGKTLQRDIQRAAAGFSGVRFGGVSSGLIVADVAVAVAVVGLAVALSGFLRDAWMADEDTVGISAGEFLAAELSLSSLEMAGGANAGDDEFRARLGTTVRELIRRIEAEPGVRSVAVASALPRMNHRTRRIEIEADGSAGGILEYRVRTASVDVDFFRALQQPMLAGRDFDSRDLAAERSTVVVNTNFIATVLGGRSAIGRRLRYRASDEQEPGPWYEIVGVVGQLGMHVLAPDLDGGIYHPAAPGEIHPAQLAVQLSDDPALFAPRLRELAGEVDPLAVIAAPVVLSDVYEGDWYFMAAVVLGIMALAGILLTLAASGIYAIMSFTVAERTREIGIRTALGAQRSDIVFAVAKRAMVQLGLGVVLGMPIAGFFFNLQYPEATYGAILLTLAPGVAVMVVVGLLACGAPTLRAMRVAPTEALR